MTEQGTVVKLFANKLFGFILRPDGSELFFHFNKYPRGQKPAVGDELEYEVGTDQSKPAGKQNFADTIKVLGKSSLSAKPARASANDPSSKLDGEFVFDKPEEKTDPTNNAKFYEIQLAVVVKYDGKPAKGVTVKCKLWDNPLGPMETVVTPANGIVYFNASVSEDAKLPYFQAFLAYGKETKTISSYWGPTVPQPVAASPKPISLEIKQGERVIGDTITFVTKADSDKPCKGSVSVSISSGFKQLVNLNDSSKSASSPVTWETNDQGELPVKIITEECYHEVTGALKNDPAKTARTEVYDV